jgi:hypothetical protein
VHASRSFTVTARWPALFLFAIAILACSCAVVLAGSPSPRSKSPVIQPVEALSRGKLGLADDDEEPMVPISRVVPRVKTIPPGHDQAHRLPPNYQELGVWSQAEGDADEELEETEDGIDENDLPPPIEEEPRPKARRARIRPVRPSKPPRPSRSARRVAAEAADAAAAFAEDDAPLEPEPAETSAIPGLVPDPAASDPLAPEPDPFVSDPNAPAIPGSVLSGDWWADWDTDEYDISPPPQGVDDCRHWGPLRKFLFFNKTNGDIGIGHERVMFAPFVIETSQPQNNFRLRMMSAFNMQTPDRAEFIWAKIGGGGPGLPEKNLDYQQFDAIYEAGGNRFSFVTDIPLRHVDPKVNASGAGLGNISLAPKMVLVNGTDWQITTLFRTYLPSGGATRGTSNGLTSLEPGVLVRYRWSPATYVHGQLKYWIPVSGDPIASGNVFNFAMGVSHVLHETDSFAIIPVLEVVGYTVGGGTATLPSGAITSADTTFANILPGVRFVLGPKGDLGLCEFGISGGFATSNTGWYREQFTVELRWSW